MPRITFIGNHFGFDSNMPDDGVTDHTLIQSRPSAPPAVVSGQKYTWHEENSTLANEIHFPGQCELQQVDLQTTNESIHVKLSGSGPTSWDIVVRTTNGLCAVSLPPNFLGEVEMATTNGTVYYNGKELGKRATLKSPEGKSKAKIKSTNDVVTVFGPDLDVVKQGDSKMASTSRTINITSGGLLASSSTVIDSGTGSLIIGCNTGPVFIGHRFGTFRGNVSRA